MIKSKIFKNQNVAKKRRGDFRLLRFALLCCSLIWASSGTAQTFEAFQKSVERVSMDVVKKQGPECLGATIQGYQLQDYDRVFFNGLRYYLTEKYDSAFAAFMIYMAQDSVSATPYYYQAHIMGQYSLNKLSLIFARKAARLSPKNKWVQSLYAGLLAFGEQYDSAANIFMAIGKDHSGDRDNSFLAAARLYHQAGNADRAIEVLDTLLLLHESENELLLREKQGIYVAEGRYGEAREVTQRLVRAYPLSPEYQVQLAEIFLLEGNKAEADNTVRKLEQEFSWNDDVASYIFGYYLKGRDKAKVASTLAQYLADAEKSVGNEYQTVTTIAQYIREHPEDTTVMAYISEVGERIAKEQPQNLTAQYFSASMNLYGKEVEQGVAKFNTLIEQHPERYSFWFPLLSHYVRRKDKLDSALYLLDKMEQYFPDSLDIPMQRMYIYADKGDLAKAIDFGLKGMDMAQKQNNKTEELVFHNSIATYYYSRKMYPESDSTFEALLLKDPDNMIALNNFAYYLSERGLRLDYALGLSKKSLEIDFNNANNLDTYAWILYKLGRYQEAREYIIKAIKVAGREVSAEILEHYADILFKLGEETEALSIWKLIDEAGQGSEKLKQKIKHKKLYE